MSVCSRQLNRPTSHVQQPLPFITLLDLNHLLLFVACVSPVIVLARTWRRAAFNRNWQLAAVIVLCVTALAYAFTPRQAGFVGGATWMLLLLAPAFGVRRATELASEERFAAARRVLGLLRFLHPIVRLRNEHRLLRALELAQRGDRRAAENILAELVRATSPVAPRATAHLFRLRSDWDGLVTWSQQNLPRVGLGESPELLPLYFRALGETGRRDELLRQFAGRAASLLASPHQQGTAAAGLLLVLAFCGRTSALLSLFKNRLPRLPRDLQQFWLATAEAISGEPGKGRERFQRLHRTTPDALLRAECEARVQRPDLLSVSKLSSADEATVSRFERMAERRGGGSPLWPRSGRITPAVLFIIALNLVMFLAEIALGGSTSDLTLHKLGALEPSAVWFGGQYWRLGAALFLHYGPLHLLLNLYALYVLGPPLETAIGGPRFTLSYLLAGLGSSIGVVLLWRYGLTKADFLVGASGAVMGVVGAWAGLLARHRHLPMARRRLASIGLIVLIQITFDLWTPQISMAAHLSGLLPGVLIGFLLAPADEFQAARPS